MELIDFLREKVLVLDGAMGTMIQRRSLTEEDFRHGLDIPAETKLQGCNDILCVTRPDVIRDIHMKYLEAGADIIETNSFNANSISLEEYGLQDLVKEINLTAAKAARDAADSFSHKSGKRVFVAGSMGPSNVALSLPDVAGARGVDFDSMRKAYAEQASALAEGGVDVLLLETIFDTLNAKAAITGIEDAFEAIGRRLPLMISVTLTEQGRTLSGQTPEGFLTSVMHAQPLSVGMNCGFGAKDMAPWLERMQSVGCAVSLHPNAGLPDEMGLYTETPETMAATMGEYLRAGMLNIAGGCCGTTPEHIRAIAEAARDARIRPITAPGMVETRPDVMRLAGLESLEVSPEKGFLKVGERCNVAGSRKFLRLVGEGNLSEALGIASAQIGKGAGVLDINMDDAMLDAPAEMERFVTLLGADGDTAAVPLMVDSSDFEVVRRALRRIQGRAIVNSISLKEGEEKFLANAREIRSMGAAAVVMAFDEQGQATTLERRKEICGRAYRLLTEKCGYRGEDIVFDPNILTIATGMPEHDRYALDFLDAVSWIKENLKGAKVSGGVSNLSFAFRGNNKLREAMHAVFLHHAIARGMDMAIVNPSTAISADGVDPTLREAIEDVIFLRRPDASERLLAIAAEMKAEADRLKAEKPAAAGSAAPKPDPKKETVTLESLVEKGMTAGLEPLLDAALEEEGTAMGVVGRRLMGAMRTVGDEFGAGRMFLPQVVRSAAVMKKAIDYLTPRIEAEAISGADGAESGEKGKFVIATVKGDVHDIGKNIVGVILKCAGFDVIDLGVMVEEEKILEALRATGARFLGLSGLITPSLSEMARVAEMLQREGLTDVTLCVGGATTTDLHTAVKIAPLFDGLTLHTRDAAQLPVVASSLVDSAQHDATVTEIRESQRRLRSEYEQRMALRAAGMQNGSASAADESVKADRPMPAPETAGVHTIEISVKDAAESINWKAFLHTWHLSPMLAAPALEAATKECDGDEAHSHAPHGAGCPCCSAKPQEDPALEEATRLVRDALAMIAALEENGVKLEARVGVVDAHRDGEDIVLESHDRSIVIPTLRRETEPRLATADFVAESGDHAGVFAVTARNVLSAVETADDYQAMLLQSIADRLAEAATEVMHTRLHEDIWGLKGTPRGIRPAVGYPSLPDQTLVFELDKLIEYSAIGVTLTANGALSPSATTTGLVFANPLARYFELGEISQAALSDYARRRGISEERLRELLPRS